MKYKIIVSILIVLLVSTSAISIDLFTQVEHQKEIISELQAKIASTPKTTKTPSGRSNYGNIVAVRSDDNTGVMGKVAVEIRNGSGRVLMNTNPFVEPDTQYSAQQAVKVAANFTRANLSDKDVVISFDINGTLIGGPSAGGAIAATTIACIQNKSVNPNAVITGTIKSNGEIGQVGGVFEKAEAAAEHGIDLFIVPDHQSIVTHYKTEEVSIGPFTVLYQVPEKVNLSDYMSEYDMDVIEASNIGEVAKYLIRR